MTKNSITVLQVVVGLVVLLVLLAIAGKVENPTGNEGVKDAGVLFSTPLDRFSTQPEEDEPGWNCMTMGNRICGPHTYTPGH